MDYLDSGSMYGSLDSAPLAPSDAMNGANPQSLTPASAAKTGPIIKEKIPAAPDTDTSTKQTIAKMCEYIAAGASDDVCKFWALQAKERWAQGPDLAQQCWGVWWLVKHAVKFAKDEPRLFQIGEPDALDLLIAPAVLVREQDRKEDCDGFTMLVCCLLKILGIPSVIVTVAADPSDPERWSHVFPMAEVNGAYLPMDASHGKFPGWMVPRDHISRWQAWDLNGNPVQAFPSQAKNTLHGYLPRGVPMRVGRARRRGMRGLGQDLSGEVATPTDYNTYSTSSGDYQAFSDGTILDPNGNSVSSIPGYTPLSGPLQPGQAPAYAPIPSTAVSTPATPTTTSAAGTPTNWTGIINSIVSGGLKAAQLATLPPGYVIGANGQPVYTGQSAANAQLTSSFASILPWLAIGLVAAVVVIPLLGSKQ